jgi:23S rRNA pseudouridine2605 synthase/16S rRNA pseudouridine516 synthase
VRLDAREEKEPMAPVHPHSLSSLDGREVSLAWRTRVLQFHKPAGVVTHGSDPEGIGTVFDALRSVLAPELQGFGWHAVGRLDRDTTGLLLFTNDEKFVAHATAPATHLPKRYLARVGAKVNDAKLEPLRRGVKLDDGELTRPALARARGEDSVELVLTEGRFHQVKRMLNVVGLPTLALHREAVGLLELDVALGAYRELRDEEVKAKLNFSPRASV